MNNQSILRCSDMGQVLELNLSNQSPDMSSVDFSKCNTVFEDGWYEIDFLCDNVGGRYSLPLGAFFVEIPWDF